MPPRARSMIGQTFGTWTVVGVRRLAGSKGERPVVRCDRCGSTVVRHVTEARIAAGCRACGDTGGKGATDAAVVARARELLAMPALDPDLPWDDDEAARALVEARGRLSLNELGAAFGVSRERIRQIEARALQRLGYALEAAGWTRDAVLAWLGRDEREHPLAGSMHAEAEW